MNANLKERSYAKGEREGLLIYRTHDYHLLPNELSIMTITAKIVPPMRQHPNVTQKQTL